MIHGALRQQPFRLYCSVVLLKHDLFQNLRERVAAGIRTVLLLLCNRHGMGIKEVPESGIAADEDELPEGAAAAALFEKPEKALYGYIHHEFFCFLAGRAMDNVRYALHSLSHHGTFADRSTYDLDPHMRLRLPIVT